MKKIIHFFLLITGFLLSGDLLYAHQGPQALANNEGRAHAMGRHGEVDVDWGISKFMRSCASRLCRRPSNKTVVATAAATALIATAMHALEIHDYELFQQKRAALSLLLSGLKDAAWRELQCHWCIIKHILGLDIPVEANVTNLDRPFVPESLHN